MANKKTIEKIVKVDGTIGLSLPGIDKIHKYVKNNVGQEIEIYISKKGEKYMADARDIDQLRNLGSTYEENLRVRLEGCASQRELSKHLNTLGRIISDSSYRKSRDFRERHLGGCRKNSESS